MTKEVAKWLHERARNVGGCWFMLTGAAAYRLAYRLHKGPIHAGFEIHHKCGNHQCVNPDHLEQVSHAGHQRRHFPTTVNTLSAEQLAATARIAAEMRAGRDAYYKTRPFVSFEPDEGESSDNDEIGFVSR